LKDETIIRVEIQIKSLHQKENRSKREIERQVKRGYSLRIDEKE